MMLWSLSPEQLHQDWWDEEEEFWALITSDWERLGWRLFLSLVQVQRPSINLFLGL